MDKKRRRNKRPDPLGDYARRSLTPEVAAIIDANDGWPTYDEDGNMVPKGRRKYRRVA